MIGHFVFKVAGDEDRYPWEGPGYFPGAVGLLVRLVEEEGDADLRPELARASVNRGRWIVDRDGDPPAALTDFDRAVAVYRDLIERDGREDMRNDLLDALQRRSATLENLGRHEGAQTDADEIVRLRRRLLDERLARQDLETLDPEEKRRSIAWFQYGRGRLLGQLGRRDDAIAAFDEAIVLLRAVIARERERYDRARVQDLRNLAVFAGGRGTVLREAGQPEAAVAALSEAVRLWDQAIARERAERCSGPEERHDRDLVWLRVDVVQPANLLGHVLRGLGRLEEAVAAYGAAAELYCDLIGRANARIARQIQRGFLTDHDLEYEFGWQLHLRPHLAAVLTNRAEVLRELSQHEEATVAFAEATKLCDADAERMPESLRYPG